METFPSILTVRPPTTERAMSKRQQQPFFDASQLPTPVNEYVAWVDVMGSQNSMKRSLQSAANAVFKLHGAALEAPRNDIRLYPVIDGLFALGRSQENIIEFLQTVFEKIATAFLKAKDQRYRFVIKGALSFGPVVHGADIPGAAGGHLRSNPEYRNSIAIGMPLVHCIQVEHKAPPFGLFVHESARAFCNPGEEPLTEVWLSWCPTDRAMTLCSMLVEYFDWCSARAGGLEYPRERIDVHRRMTMEYFAE